jgi:uncharacterized protein
MNVAAPPSGNLPLQWRHQIVNFGVGLTINYLGVRSTVLLAEALDAAPFAKQLYSSDAFGPPELHLPGSVL